MQTNQTQITVWHDSNNEQPKHGSTVLVLIDDGAEVLTNVVEVLPNLKWAYIDDLADFSCQGNTVVEDTKESQSEKELAETYLAFFDKNHPGLPTLKGLYANDFKNFLNKCQQEFGLKYFGEHPTQAKLFEKMALLWAFWGADHLIGNKKQFKLTKSETELANEFEKEHAHPEVYKGAIGGHISYKFTPTALANACEISCSICGESKNITDYDNW
jgi:hypothetical protein